MFSVLYLSLYFLDYESVDPVSEVKAALALGDPDNGAAYS